MGDGRRGDDHSVHVPAGEELLEIIVERDAALVGLRPAPLYVLIPDGAEFRLRMLFGLRGVVFCVHVPEAQDRDAEHQLISSISLPGVVLVVLPLPP
jgi:hypothetical protein